MSTATFDVSWKNEVHGCMYEEASNYNPIATVPDLSCVFEIKGCPFAAAVNYKWCEAQPFVCRVPNSCLRLDNKKGEVKSITTGTLGNKAGCLNRASDRFTVKWCEVVPFDTAAPTGAPAP